MSIYISLRLYFPMDIKYINMPMRLQRFSLNNALIYLLCNELHIIFIVHMVRIQQIAIHYQQNNVK